MRTHNKENAEMGWLQGPGWLWAGRREAREAGQLSRMMACAQPQTMMSLAAAARTKSEEEAQNVVWRYNASSELEPPNRNRDRRDVRAAPLPLLRSACIRVRADQRG